MTSEVTVVVVVVVAMVDKAAGFTTGTLLCPPNNGAEPKVDP